MGRPGEKTKVVAVRLPEDVHDEWERRAEAKGRPLATHLREKLTEAVRGATP